MTTSAAGRWWRACPLAVRLAIALAIGLAPALAVILGAVSVKSVSSSALLAIAGLSLIVALAGTWLAGMRVIGADVGRLAAAVDRRAEPDIDQASPEFAAIIAALQAMEARIAAGDRDLQAGLVEKDGLLREIHHRVKNNLQVISSLLNIQQRALSDPAARSALSDTRQRIAALALIYRALYEGPDIRRVDLAAFLESLIDQLILDDSGVRLKVATDLSIDELIIDPDRLAPLALFAVEAIVSAIKQGLAQDGGRLLVRFRVRESMAELSIAGGCRGATASADLDAGVGRTLMGAFARQLGGKVAFVDDEDMGATVRLDFPAPAA